jgi:PAS domain S-box-containing protein
MPREQGSAEAWEKLFWSVFERSTNAILLLDDHRVIAEVNAAMCKLLGVSHEDIVRQRLDRFLAADERQEVDAEWRSHLEAEDVTGERHLIRADGSRLYLKFAAHAGEVGGRLIEVVVFLGASFEEEPEQPAQQGELTARERDVLSLVALGNTSLQIADQLVISPESVHTHVRDAMAKTGARTRAQLVAIALADRHLGG